MFDFSSIADDSYVNLHLNTEMELPLSRENVLHYFERMRKAFPELRKFFTRENGDFVLEGDKESGPYRWLSLETRRLCSGYVNPRSPQDAYKQHDLVLELAPHLLTLSTLDCEALDLMYGFDFNYEGNHDEVIAEAFGLGSALEGLLDVEGSRLMNYEPSITLSLDDDCRLQCRLSVETRTTDAQVRNNTYADDQISVYFTVRQYWDGGPDIAFLDSFRRQREIGEELLETRVLPKILKPLVQVIASR